MNTTLKLVVTGAVFIAFTAFSLVVIYRHGYVGFLVGAWRDPWALQVLLDLVIALSVVAAWMRKDARERGVVVWPFIVGMMFLGSVALLPYLLLRQLQQLRRRPERASGSVAIPAV